MIINISKDKVFYNLGKELAKLHKFSDNWIKPDNFYKREWDINGLVGENPIWDKFWENPKLSNKQIKTSDATSSDVIVCAVCNVFFIIWSAMMKLDYEIL